MTAISEPMQEPISGGKSKPKAKTIEMLRQFARVYTAVDLSCPGLRGVVLN